MATDADPGAPRPDDPAAVAAAPPDPADSAAAHSHLFGRGMLYVVVWSLQLVAGTVVSPILAYALGPSEFGALASAIALHQVLSVLALLGLDQAVILQRAEDGDERSARGLISVGIALSLVVTLTAGLTAPFWTQAFGFGHLSALVVATILWTAPGAGVQVMLALLLAQDRLRWFSIVSALSAVGGQVVGLCLLFLVHQDATTYAWGGVASQFAAMLIGLAVTRPYLRGLLDWKVAWRAVKLGAPLAMGGLAFFVLNAGDRIIIQRILGAEEVGRYQVAYTVGYVVVMLLTFTSSAWTPRFAAVRNDAERWTLSLESRDALYRMLLPVTLGITLAAPVALRVVAPPSYRPDTLLVVVFLVALSAFPVAASGASGRLLTIQRRGKTLALITGVAAVINVALNLVLIPPLGIAGAAAATLVSFGVMAVLQQRSLPREPAWRGAPRGLTLSAVVVVAISTASCFLPQDAFWNWTKFGIALACLPWFYARLQSARRGSDGATGGGASRWSALTARVRRSSPSTSTTEHNR